MSATSGRARTEAREPASARRGRERFPRPGAMRQDAESRRAIPGLGFTGQGFNKVANEKPVHLHPMHGLQQARARE